MNHDQAVSQYRELLEQIKKWLANIETDGKIEKEAVTNITEMFTIISDLKTAVFEYKESCMHLSGTIVQDRDTGVSR